MKKFTSVFLMIVFAMVTSFAEIFAEPKDQLKMNLQTFATAGKSAVVKIGANTIQGLNDAKITINGNTIDVTDFASGGWIAKIQGLKSAEISIAGFYLSTDANGQTALRTALLSGADVAMSVLLDGTTGWSGNFKVTKFEDGATVAGEVTRSISLESNGAITSV